METLDPNLGLPATHHEAGDPSVRPILWTLAGLAIGVALVGLAVYGIFWYLADHPAAVPVPNPMAETEPEQIPPAPRVEEHPAIEIQQLHSQEDRLLSTYGWSDKQHGIVRVPIDRAMELQLQQGFSTERVPSKPSPNKPGGKR
jgi:hypothetical protein